VRDQRNEQRPIRCAIYTRKSTEEGLDQEFNSLDAQREACAAYILSQRHEGWAASAELYDDGGFTGGNMDRPGLKQLMADVAAGKINVIVVYKVDRLTRSLADFAKIVDVLDAAGASFVSITQSFNTTTSMGRLTLNVLLSFAQFEREVTGERIRDKIAASKKKGLWMGGPVPLGYDIQDRKLVVNDEEAETVRHIMRQYIELGSVRRLIDELARDGRITKVQQRASGPHKGGIAFGRGTLFHLLKNRIYRGEIVHKGTAYPGEHRAIVSQDLWDAVQQKLGEHTSRRKLGGGDHPSLLIGLIRDGYGRKMSPSHAVKGPKRYRYYITHSGTGPNQPAWRVSAHDLERIVIGRLVGFLNDAAAVNETISIGLNAAEFQTSLATAHTAAEVLVSGSSVEQRSTLLKFVARIDLHDDRVDIAIRVSAISAAEEDRTFTLTTTTTRIRRGHDVKLVVAAPSSESASCNPRLIKMIADAHVARQRVLDQPTRSMSQIAADLGRCRGDLADQMRLSYLAPDIVTAILEGRHPSTLNRKTLAATDLPLDWSEQRRMLGFA
jgi:site-specific DNA recombinase